MLTSSFVNRIISTSAKGSSNSTICKIYIRHTSRLQQSQGEPTFTFKNIANLQNRLRPGKIKSKKKLIPGKDSWSVVGYATANEYNLVALVEKFIEDVSSYLFTLMIIFLSVIQNCKSFIFFSGKLQPN